MTAAELIQQAQADGVQMTLTPSGRLKLSGDHLPAATDISPDAGRRALARDQASELRGRRYNRTKRQVSNPNGIGGKSGKSIGAEVAPINTAKALAEQHGVSERTIKSDGRRSRMRPGETFENSNHERNDK